MFDRHVRKDGAYEDDELTVSTRDRAIYRCSIYTAGKEEVKSRTPILYPSHSHVSEIHDALQ
jgi:hypothetical protein